MILRLIAILLAGFGFLTGCGGAPRPDDCILIEENEIAFPGVLYPDRYNQRSDRALGHHFIVWSGGGAAGKALIETPCPDREILDALIAIGAASGENLSAETWTQRNNPDSPSPDQRVEGARVQITVIWNGTETPAHELFDDVSAEGLDIRVGGHAELIPLWRSGCVTCLFSCPGGRTSNASFTIRDQAQERMNFRANAESLPEDGTSVRVRIRLSETIR